MNEQQQATLMMMDADVLQPHTYSSEVCLTSTFQLTGKPLYYCQQCARTVHADRHTQTRTQRHTQTDTDTLT